MRLRARTKWKVKRCIDCNKVIQDNKFHLCPDCYTELKKNERRLIKNV